MKSSFNNRENVNKLENRVNNEKNVLQKITISCTKFKTKAKGRKVILQMKKIVLKIGTLFTKCPNSFNYVLMILKNMKNRFENL